jgi:hypothetical protein
VTAAYSPTAGQRRPSEPSSETILAPGPCAIWRTGPAAPPRHAAAHRWRSGWQRSQSVWTDSSKALRRLTRAAISQVVADSHPGSGEACCLTTSSRITPTALSVSGQRRNPQVDLAYRWFRDVGIEDKVPGYSVLSRARDERFRDRDIVSSQMPAGVHAPHGRHLAQIPGGRKSMVRSFIFAAASAVLLTVTPIASAKAAELNVLAGGSMTDSLREIAPRFERPPAIGLSSCSPARRSLSGRQPRARRSTSASFQST